MFFGMRGNNDKRPHGLSNQTDRCQAQDIIVVEVLVIRWTDGVLIETPRWSWLFATMEVSTGLATLQQRIIHLDANINWPFCIHKWSDAGHLFLKIRVKNDHHQSKLQADRIPSYYLWYMRARFGSSGPLKGNLPTSIRRLFWDSGLFRKLYWSRLCTLHNQDWRTDLHTNDVAQVRAPDNPS